jgi:hypothetical protein
MEPPPPSAPPTADEGRVRVAVVVRPLIEQELEQGCQHILHADPSRPQVRERGSEQRADAAAARARRETDCSGLNWRTVSHANHTLPRPPPLHKLATTITTNQQPK